MSLSAPCPRQLIRPERPSMCGAKPETRSKELETIQNRVSTLRDSKTRWNELETLRRRLADEIDRAGTRGGDVRKQVTDQLIGRARKARARVEPVGRGASSPSPAERVEPTVRRVRGRYAGRKQHCSPERSRPMAGFSRSGRVPVGL